MVRDDRYSGIAGANIRMVRDDRYPSIAEANVRVSFMIRNSIYEVKECS